MNDPRERPRTMIRISHAPELLAVVGGVGALCAYRAATQSITYDEACTYLEFLSGPWSTIFTRYTANNHVLFSALAKLSTTAFGVGELSLRLPTLLGATLYLASVVILCRRLTRHRLTVLLGVALLSLNPFVLDFLVAARGYGLALGLLLAAVALLGDGLDARHGGPQRRRLALASLALGLTVAASFTFAFAVAGVLAAALLVLALAPAPPGVAALACLVVPGLLVAAPFVAVPLLHGSPEHFFYGAATLRESVGSLITATARYHDPTATIRPRDPVALVTALAPAGMALLGIHLVRTVRAGLATARAGSTYTLGIVAGGGTLLAPALAAVAHAGAGVPYPLERTGLYLIPLFTLAVLTVVARASHTPRRRRCLLLASLAGAAVLVCYATQLDWRSFRTWRFDAASREVFERARGASPPGPCPRRLAASWVYEPSLRFYAALARDPCPIEVVPNWRWGAPGYDLYVQSVDEAPPPGRLEVLHVDAVSGARLLIDRQRSR